MENGSDVKMVIVMRRDLNMRKGKMAAQAGHAIVSFLHQFTISMGGNNITLALPKNYLKWLHGGQKKICVGVNSEEELETIRNIALDYQLNVGDIITDAGHTEFHGVPTKTCFVIGPNKSKEIDLVTGNLKLL